MFKRLTLWLLGVRGFYLYRGKTGDEAERYRVEKGSNVYEVSDFSCGGLIYATRKRAFV